MNGIAGERTQLPCNACRRAVLRPHSTQHCDAFRGPNGSGWPLGRRRVRWRRGRCSGSERLRIAAKKQAARQQEQSSSVDIHSCAASNIRCIGQGLSRFVLGEHGAVNGASRGDHAVRRNWRYLASWLALFDAGHAGGGPMLGPASNNANQSGPDRRTPTTGGVARKRPSALPGADRIIFAVPAAPFRRTARQCGSRQHFRSPPMLRCGNRPLTCAIREDQSRRTRSRGRNCETTRARCLVLHSKRLNRWATQWRIQRARTVSNAGARRWREAAILG